MAPNNFAYVKYLILVSWLITRFRNRVPGCWNRVARIWLLGLDTKYRTAWYWPKLNDVFASGHSDTEECVNHDYRHDRKKYAFLFSKNFVNIFSIFPNDVICSFHGIYACQSEPAVGISALPCCCHAGRNFKDFKDFTDSQRADLFSRTFQVLKMREKNSGTFKDLWEPWAKKMKIRAICICLYTVTTQSDTSLFTLFIQPKQL